MASKSSPRRLTEHLCDNCGCDLTEEEIEYNEGWCDDCLLPERSIIP